MYQTEPISFDFPKQELPTTNLSLIDKKVNSKNNFISGIFVGVFIVVSILYIYDSSTKTYNKNIKNLL